MSSCVSCAAVLVMSMHSQSDNRVHVVFQAIYSVAPHIPPAVMFPGYFVLFWPCFFQRIVPCRIALVLASASDFVQAPGAPESSVPSHYLKSSKFETKSIQKRVNVSTTARPAQGPRPRVGTRRPCETVLKIGFGETRCETILKIGFGENSWYFIGFKGSYFRSHS